MQIAEHIHGRLTTLVCFPLTNFLFNRRHITLEYKGLKKVARMPEEQLHAFQLERIRAQLTFAMRWVPFYAERFQDIGLDPRDVRSLDDLSKIPTLTRADLLEHHRALVDRRQADAVDAVGRRGAAGLGNPVPFAPFRKHRIVKHTSSGSTGEPVTYYQDGSTSAASWAFERLFKGWFNVTPGAKEVRMTRLAGDFMPGGASVTLRKLLWRQQVLPGINLTHRDYALSYDILESYRPTVLWGFTSALRGLAEYMVAEGKTLSYRPQLVITWAEPMLDYEEQVLGQAFSCRATNLYSSHEVGHIACRCPEGQFHINQRHLLVEVDRSGTDRGEAEAGEIVVTTLFDSPMPFIRYRLGDLGNVRPSRCPCGCSLQVLHKLLGRTYELFTTRDGRMISPNFWLHLFRRDHMAGFIKRFQAVYKKDGNILVQVIRKPDYPLDTEPQLRRLVQENFGSATQVEWIYVDDIEPEPSGKVPIVKHEK